jgi:hypothetical protein
MSRAVTFCPFCGVKYPRKDDEQTEEVAALTVQS